MKKTVIRSIVVAERDLPTLMKKALGKSDYGNKKLYDTVDFRLLTEQDFTIYLLKNPTKDSMTPEGHMRRWVKQYHLYREDYYYWFFRKQDRMIRISPNTGRNRYRWDNLGMATLTKTFS
jgi:hypothetical protein